ncbi:MAG: hypothetical protein ACFFDI_24175 [Promethearchaeota archaeon]
MKCRKCGHEYEQKLRTRSDPDRCPKCGWAHWDPTGRWNRDWKPPEE